MRGLLLFRILIVYVYYIAITKGVLLVNSQVRDIKALYLFHNRPAWYQFVTAAFCHANW